MGFLRNLRSRLGSDNKKIEEEGEEEAHLPRLSLDETLGSPDPEVRLHAVSAIGEIGKAAIPLLITALHDESWRVRRGAAAGLIRIREPAVAPMIRTFEGGRSDVRRELIRALHLIGDTAFPSLVSALNSPSPEIRSGAIETIALMGGERRVEPLNKALSDEDPMVRAAAARAYGYLPDDRAIPTLLLLFGDHDERVRNAAIHACTQLGTTAIPPLIQALQGADPEIRPRIEEAMTQIGSPASGKITPLLQHEDPTMRVTGIRILGRIRDLNAVSHLIGALADPDPEVRDGAIIALTAFGPSALPEVTAAFESQESRIREGAMEILAGIGEPAVPTLVRYLRNEDPAVRRQATVVLGEIGSHEAHEPLTDLLRDSDPTVRRQAFEALERLRR